jgi:K+-sensing histidine kinase KdpD
MGDMENYTNLSKSGMLSCPTVLTGMSHELRTHMNAVVAFSYLMKDESCSNADREEFSHQILNACEELIDLFDSFLDSAVIDTGNSKADQKKCKFNNFLDDLLSEFREALNKENNSNIELVTEIQYSNPLEFLVDKNKIYRVLRSLFQNSLRSTKSGYIKIGYFLRNDKLILYILDSGQGYFKSKELLETEDMSESLSKHNDTITTVNIVLVKKLIKMMDGTISVACNGLTGTGIYISVPTKLTVSSNISLNNYTNTMIAI